MVGSLADVVAATGWIRTLGGVDGYLALRARQPGLRRAAVDEAIRSGALQVIPAVRGCIYLVPRAEVPLALRIAEAVFRPSAERDLKKVGASWKLIEEVAAAAKAALQAGPLSPDALRKALPAGAVPSFGEAGKKAGIASPLPMALRTLEFAGAVRRTLPDGRLDSERYVWQLTTQSPFTGARIPDEPAARLAELAAIFFRHAAPASVRSFAEWSALPLRDCRAAVASLGLVPIAVSGAAEPHYGYAEDLVPTEPSGAVRLLPFDDNYHTDHGGPAPLVDPAWHALTVPVWGAMRGEGGTLGTSKHVSLRSICIGPELAGFWEYDPDGGEISAKPFSVLKKTQRDALAEACSELAAFLRDELGHGRSFSLDTDDELRQRVRLLRGLAAPAAAS